MKNNIPCGYTIYFSFSQIPQLPFMLVILGTFNSLLSPLTKELSSIFTCRRL
ncbi:hypothetical protein Fmac_015968 [Flemingia macrophylla]|uniref:Uncharacterized protein n=1 Tax=Flemingia macrophylla TaxID=520843 RepID=A0ABD1MG23_9FABA